MNKLEASAPIHIPPLKSWPSGFGFEVTRAPLMRRLADTGMPVELMHRITQHLPQDQWLGAAKQEFGPSAGEGA